jgi:hypothetical protein
VTLTASSSVSFRTQKPSCSVCVGPDRAWCLLLCTCRTTARVSCFVRALVCNGCACCAVCSEGALDRCIEDFTLAENNDFVRKEIALSLRMGKRIVPVLTPGFSWPARLADVPDIRDIQRKNGVVWIQEYVSACMDKLVRFLTEPKSSALTGLESPSVAVGGTPSV